MFCNPSPRGAVSGTSLHIFPCLTCPGQTIQVNTNVKEREDKAKQDIIIVRKISCSLSENGGESNMYSLEILDPNSCGVYRLGKCHISAHQCP